MNRETESHFANMPRVEIQRSKMKRPHTHKTTFDSGDLIPIYLDQDILPGDTVSIDMGSIIRMTTPIYPVMDNSFIDVYFFFVPNRLVWEHWEEFWGQNDDTAWTQPVEYEIPQIESPVGGWENGTLADYMGLPTYLSNISVSALPFRAYAKIVNDWFRDENLKDGTYFPVDETTVTGVNTGNYVTDIVLGGKPYKAAKIHDYFTSALPSPQKGPEMVIGKGLFPVIPGERHNLPISKWDTDPRNYQPINDYTTFKAGNYESDGTGYKTKWEDYVPTGDTNMIFSINSSDQVNKGGYLAKATGSVGTPSGGSFVIDNYWANTQISINDLRNALAIQEFYEAQARYGSRYTEFIRGIFGVTSPDARLQRSEYLGGYRTPINVTQVLQTSSTDAVSPQGNTGAYSYTPDQRSVFTQSFTEHGILLGLAVIRTDNTYQQGIERGWSRKKWTDFYIPQFAHLGEQAILNKEIYAQGTTADDEAFGYQEAFADYRYKPSRVSGVFRSNNPGGSLDAWHYADNYNALPVLGETWIDEPKSRIARTLAVQDEPQFIADFYFDATYVRPMPVYSIPGLAMHY